MHFRRKTIQATRKGLRAFAALMLAAAFGLIGQATAQAVEEPLRSIPRFSDVLNVPVAGGPAAPLRVEIKDWNLVATPKPFEVPAQGFYIVQLRSGKVITEIAGKSERRKPGDFWTVAAGVPMGVTLAPHGEAAQLETIAVNPQP
jgi:hypothetical protein